MIELPVPVPVPGCATCAEFQKDLRAVEPQTSAETDVRVLWRRHQAAEHGITVPEVRI
ncbi:hypothetical protein [Kitasatospora azatica]|uniref:hypothetical protein n=1 Tax=Kitasatospora azatica TaxID=58347 RepID=UPI000A73B1D9|nr:hypothetical protein [Kitasatospora azatica]